MGTERYHIIITYDGTDFHGFQRQGKKRTVQGEIENALRLLSWKGRSILAAGRTDTGVHASGQVIAFDLDWTHQEDDLRDALNAHLPRDMAVKTVCKAPPDFHPRFDACWRTYEYHLFVSPMRDPLRERYAWRIEEEVDLQIMNVAAALLCGTHDFAIFGRAPDKCGSTNRTVFIAKWRSWSENQPEGGLVFMIRASSFLYHMVRRLVFVQVLAGWSRLDLSLLEEALSTGKAIRHGLAPAQGLVLREIGYWNDDEMKCG